MGAPSRRRTRTGDPEPSSRTWRLAYLAVVPLVLIMLSACGLFREDDERPDYWSPFHSQASWEVDDGSYRVELRGFERGHQPGRQSDFAFTIQNLREEPADIGVCVKLIDELDVIQELHEFTTSVSAQGSVTRPFETTFEEDLEPRAYGLAIVINDLGALVHTVRLGIADDEAGPWLDANQLTCDA